jgi:hypothetical protein
LPLPSGRGHSLGTVLSLRALVNGAAGRAAAMGLTATPQMTAAARVAGRMSTQLTVGGLGMVLGM